MNTTSEADEEPATLWEWLDAFAQGTAPLPRYRFVAKPPRAFGVVRVILAWTFTLATLLILAAGTLLSGVFIASWYYVYPAIGFWIWHITMVLAAMLGTLAFICIGRFQWSGMYAMASLLANYCYIFAQLGLASLEPLLLVTPAVLITGAHAYVLWRFVLASNKRGHRAQGVEP